MSFVIYALPRSRTAWLSKFLSYRGWTCGHEEMRHLRTMEDIESWFSQPQIGSAETAAAPFWRTVQKVAPDARILVIRRNVEDVLASFAKIGVPFDPILLRIAMTRQDAKLDQIEKRVECLSVRFEDLANEETCKQVFEYCLQVPFNREWWEMWDRTNVQMDLHALYKYCASHSVQMERLASIVKQKTLSDMASERFDVDSMTYEEEDFETFYRDGKPLFKEHMALVGESPEDFESKNINLMARLDEHGHMQVVTARSNGRMFGYLMTIVAPSLESPDTTIAQHATFFASKDTPGAGLKLQRRALELLKTKGVHEVTMRAGIRGDGDRMASLYRRIGATDFGTLHKIDLRS